MKELFRFVASWIAGLFNFNLFFTDDVDSLLLQLQIIELQMEANESQYITTIAIILAAAKCVFMLFSCFMLYLLNQEVFHDSISNFWKRIKKGFWFLKDKFSNFKNKKRL